MAGTARHGNIFGSTTRGRATHPEEDHDMNDAARLPAQFDPDRTVLTGIDVLRQGLPPLPPVLTRQMAVPVAFWTAAHSAVVLFLQYSPDPDGSSTPMALMATFARDGDSWRAHQYWHAHGWHHDPIADPSGRAGLADRAVVGGGSGMFTDQPQPGHPAYVVTGRVSAAVTAVALVQDGHEDRRDLHSHFGALVICTDQASPYKINALDPTGAIIGSIGGPPTR